MTVKRIGVDFMNEEYIRICHDWIDIAKTHENAYGHLINRTKVKADQNWIWYGLAKERLEIEAAWVNVLVAFMKACK